MLGGLALSVLFSFTGAAGAETAPAEPVDCPSQREVGAELARVGAEAGTYPDIAVADGRMHVVLRGPDGTVIGHRDVEAAAGCRERALVAAVLVATWMGLWPDVPQPVSAPPEAVAVSAPAAPAPPVQSPDEPTFAVALAAAGAHDGNAPAIGLALELQRKLARALHGFVALGATTEREYVVGPGIAGYTRPAIGAGVALRLGRASLRGDLGVSEQLGLLLIRGKDLPVTHSKLRPTAGTVVHLRLMFHRSGVVPFVGVAGTYWMGQHEVTLDDSPTKAVLPRWDAQLWAGVIWSAGP